MAFCSGSNDFVHCVVIRDQARAAMLAGRLHWQTQHFGKAGYVEYHPDACFLGVYAYRLGSPWITYTRAQVLKSWKWSLDRETSIQIKSSITLFQEASDKKVCHDYFKYLCALFGRCAQFSLALCNLKLVVQNSSILRACFAPLEVFFASHH